jgi:predicted nucleic acid-binding protein
MKVFDASSIIHAWDNYPLGKFPRLWEWLAERIAEEEIAIPRPAMTEIANISDECAAWLTGNQVVIIEVSNDIANEATRIKGLLGIVNDNYHPKGVGENDILIIATANVEGVGLVSDEGRQATVPINPLKRKIPSVCSMGTIDVICSKFIGYLNEFDEVFG